MLASLSSYLRTGKSAEERAKDKALEICQLALDKVDEKVDSELLNNELWCARFKLENQREERKT